MPAEILIIDDNADIRFILNDKMNIIPIKKEIKLTPPFPIKDLE